MEFNSYPYEDNLLLNYVRSKKVIYSDGGKLLNPFLNNSPEITPQSSIRNTITPINKSIINNIILTDDEKIGPVPFEESVPVQKEDELQTLMNDPKTIEYINSLKQKQDIYSKSNSKTIDLNNIKKTQEFLAREGYDLGKYGTDGKLGPSTVRAIQQYLKDNSYYIGEDRFSNAGVDGKLGKVTSKAIDQYNKDIVDGKKVNFSSKYTDEEGFLGYCDEKQCAEFSQSYVKRASSLKDEDLKKIGLIGSAWNIHKNIIDAGGESIYDSKKGTVNKDQLTKIRPGTHISIYTGGLSPYQGTAGTGNPTHSAIVDSDIQIDNSNRPYVYIVHNVHKKSGKDYIGREYRNKLYLDKLSIKGFEHYTVENIAIPNINKDKKAVVPDMELSITTESNNRVAKDAISEFNKEKFRRYTMSDFNLDNYEFVSIAKAVLGIMDQETGMGEKGLIPLIPNSLELAHKEAAAGIIKGIRSIKGEKDEASKGWARIKFDTNFGKNKLNVKKDYGITETNIQALYDKGGNSAKAAFLILANHYSKLKSETSNNEEALYLAIQKFNRYNLDKKYGEDQKSSKDYAKDHDLSYVNKILSYSNKYDVKGNDLVSYSTITDKLNMKDKVLLNNKKFGVFADGGYLGYDVDQYGFGSWLKGNVGNLAQTIGGAALTFLVPGGQAAGIGMMASGVGGMVGSAVSGEHKDQDPQVSAADIMASRKGEYMTYATGGPIIPKLYKPSADPARLAEALPTTISSLALTNYRPSVSTKELGFGDSTPGVNIYNRGNQEWRAVFDNNDNLIADPNKQDRIIQSRTRQMIRQNVGRGVARTNDQIRKAIMRTGITPSYADGGPVKHTKLDPDREKLFQSWYKQTSKELGLDPDPDSPAHYYDYRGYYKENGFAPMTKGQHFTDKYKLPGHPTFSEESQYFKFDNSDMAGRWGKLPLDVGYGQDNFLPAGKKNITKYYEGGSLGTSLNNLDFLTEYNQGSSHEQSPYGGIPVGGKARVEKGEVRFDDPDTGESYIFSDRF